MPTLPYPRIIECEHNTENRIENYRQEEAYESLPNANHLALTSEDNK